MTDPPTERSPLTALDWIAAILVALFGLFLLTTPITITPMFVIMHDEFGGRAALPRITDLVSSPLFSLLAGATPLTLLGLGLGGRWSVGRRRLLIVAGFVVAVAGLALYLTGLYAPIFQLADQIAE